MKTVRIRAARRDAPRATTWIATCIVAIAVAARGVAAQERLTLEAALDSALARHPSVRGAAARVDAARAGRAAAAAARLPTLAGSANLTRFQEPMVVAPFHGFDPRMPPDFDRTLVQGQLALRYTLFDGGGRGARIGEAEANAEGSAAEYAETEMGLLQSVVGAYLQVLTAREVLDAAEHRVLDLEAERSRAQRFLDEGAAPRLEVMRAEAALLDARADVASGRARVDLAERDLARLMGVDPASMAGRPLADARIGGAAPEAGPKGGTPHGGEPFARAAGNGAAAAPPVVERARAVVAAAEAGLRRERATRLPTLDAAAGLLNFGTASGNFVTEWQAGFALSWPVFTGGARRAGIRAAAARLRAAREALSQTRLSVDAAADEARAALTEARGRSRALEASVRQWKEVARVEALALEEGSGVQHDYLRAQAGLYGARAAYAQARHGVSLAQVRLARALGILDRAWISANLERTP